MVLLRQSANASPLLLLTKVMRVATSQQNYRFHQRAAFDHQFIQPSRTSPLLQLPLFPLPVPESADQLLWPHPVAADTLQSSLNPP